MKKKIFLFAAVLFIGAGIWAIRHVTTTSFEKIALLTTGIKIVELQVIPDIPPTPTVAPVEGVTPGPSAVPAVTEYKLKKFPFAFSVAINDGQAFLDWWRHNPQMQNFMQSRLMQGLFDEVTATLKTRAKDLKLGTLQEDFLFALLTDIIGADAAFHYDISRGDAGMLLSYTRSKSTLSSPMLPLIIGATAQKLYKVADPRIAIIEITLGARKLYIAEERGKVLVGSSVGVLLNAVTQKVVTGSTDATLTYTVRAEAFLRNLKTVLVGRDQWHVSGAMQLSKDTAQVTAVEIDPAVIFDRFSEQISKETVSAVPSDSFVAIATSISIPTDITPEEWNQVALLEPLGRKIPVAKQGGLSLIWDITPESFGAIGIAALVPEDGRKTFENIVSADLFSGICADQKVFIASTSESLLGRMKDACNGQNRSLLNDIEDRQGVPSYTLAVLLQPAEGARGIIDQQIRLSHTEFISEHSSEDGDTNWKTEYAKAVRSAQKSADDTLIALPGIVMTGNATSSQGATLQPFFAKQLR